MMLKGRGIGNSAGVESDRPRKKLSFREPEIMGCYVQIRPGGELTLTRKAKTLPRSTAAGAADAARRNFALGASCEDLDLDLESQAMRIVRTVGQAFEVCHKLSITGPSPEEDERDALMCDADIPAGGSERDLSEILSSNDKQRKDTLSDPISCDTLAACEDDAASLHEEPLLAAPHLSTPQSQAQRPLRLDILPPPPGNHSSRRSPMSVGGETYTSPLSEPLRSEATAAMPSAGTPLSAHHEMQLLREQLEQQTQQTQAAVAQVHLLRDQLAAETAARLEAQARTHQLLVHNKELLDHITALVAHLQDQERLHQRQNSSHPGNQQHGVTMMPQLTAAAKVSRWFELLQMQSSQILSRPESGFVDGGNSMQDDYEEGDQSKMVDTSEGTESLLKRLRVRGRKRKKKILGLRLGRVTTF